MVTLRNTCKDTFEIHGIIPRCPIVRRRFATDNLHLFTNISEKLIRLQAVYPSPHSTSDYRNHTSALPLHIPHLLSSDALVAKFSSCLHNTDRADHLHAHSYKWHIWLSDQCCSYSHHSCAQDTNRKPEAHLEKN